MSVSVAIKWELFSQRPLDTNGLNFDKNRQRMKRLDGLYLCCESELNFGNTLFLAYVTTPSNSLTDNIRSGQICHDCNTIFCSNDLNFNKKSPRF